MKDEIQLFVNGVDVKLVAVEGAPKFPLRLMRTA
jgi:hypothetical protein